MNKFLILKIIKEGYDWYAISEL